MTGRSPRAAARGGPADSLTPGRPGTVPAARALPPARPGGEARFGLLLVGPSLLLLVIISTAPLLFLLAVTFFRIELTRPWATGFVGLANYGAMLADPRFWHSLRVTAVYTATSVTLQVALGLAFAIALAGEMRGRNAMRTAVLLPMVLAPVVVGLVWRTLLLTPRYGLLDYLAVLAGVGSHSWLGDPTLALGAVIALHTWQWTPFAFLVFSASLAALPVEPFEAAMLDRATAWQRFRYITLPLIRPAIVTVVVLRVIVALRAFDAIYAATGGGPGTATEILNLYAYRIAFNSLNLGYGATLTTTLLILTAAMTATFGRLRAAVEVEA
ncbi:MAG: sugar ABC transporter permease [Armatimonadota bacterium]|nr:sugar ABC transporter permease [Armatimonadota bacterium]